MMCPSDAGEMFYYIQHAFSVKTRQVVPIFLSEDDVRLYVNLCILVFHHLKTSPSVMSAYFISGEEEDLVEVPARKESKLLVFLIFGTREFL